jgi:hypothetical protein
MFFIKPIEMFFRNAGTAETNGEEGCQNGRSFGLFQSWRGS